MVILTRGILIFALATMLLFSCTSTVDTIVSPLGYDLGNPIKFTMPSSLLEISGISFYKGNNDIVYAIQDEEGKLFKLTWKEKKQVHTKFAKAGDYEDVTIYRDRVVVLKSNGELYIFPFSDVQYEESEHVQIIKHLLPEGEYEGLFGDEATGNMYVLCKNCPADNSKAAVTGYILSGNDTLRRTGSFLIDVSEIKASAGKVKRDFRPSGLAQNPITKEWVIISAVNKMLVITDDNWQVKEVYPLNGNTFNQPEGIAFDKNGNLYISNEGDDLLEGNILRFDRK